jgi:hypothetical protein
MARLWKSFKKFERTFLLGLTILLLASFVVIPALTRGCHQVGGDAEDHGGSFEPTPGKTHKVSSDEFVDVWRRYALNDRTGHGLYWLLGPTLRYAGMTDPEKEDQAPEIATWEHILLVEAAKDAGYRVGDEELRDGIQSAVSIILRRRMGRQGAELGFSQEWYDRIVHDMYGGAGTKADFEATVREVLLKDKYVTPLVDSLRAGLPRQEAYDQWKSKQERLALEYAVVQAAPFRAGVEPEEKTRETISEQETLINKVVAAGEGVRRLRGIVDQRKEQLKRWPKDEAELLGKPETGTHLLKEMPKDVWDVPFTYRLDGDKPVVQSAGPDGKPGTADDVGWSVPETLDALGKLGLVAQALLDWRTATGSWPATLADLEKSPPGKWTEPVVGTSNDPKVGEARDLLKKVTAALDAWKKANDKWPARLADLTTPPAGGGAPAFTEVPKDPWGKELVYEPTRPWVQSAGPDGRPGNSDDVRSIFNVRTPPLSSKQTDSWGHDYVYDAAAPALSSAGPDGTPGNADDLKAELSESRVAIPAPATFAPWILADEKDAWGNALKVRLRSPVPAAFEALSAGPDGVAGNDDDVVGGNSQALGDYYSAHKFDYHVGLQREIEALWVRMARVSDEALTAAWAKLPQHHKKDEIEKQAWDWFRSNSGEHGYYKTEKTRRDADGKAVLDANQKPIVDPIDPADPEKGHGVKTDDDPGGVAKGEKGWLVPAAADFGDMKDPPEKPLAAADDPLWKTYVEKGWRRILLREFFFENLLKDALARASASQKTHDEWLEKKKKAEKAKEAPPPEPPQVAFQTILSELSEFQPGEDERKQGVRFVELFATAKDKPLDRADLEKIPEFVHVSVSTMLTQLKKDGEYANIPTTVPDRDVRVALRNVRLHDARDPELTEPGIREKVWPRWLDHRAMEKASAELERVRVGLKEGDDLGKAMETAAAARKFAYHMGRTGLVGPDVVRDLPVPPDATEDKKREIREQSFVRRRGPSAVRKEGTETKVGTVAQRVLEDEKSTPDEKDKTESAYLVRVAAREDPSPDEFGGRKYVEEIARKSYRSGGQSAGPEAKALLMDQVEAFFVDFRKLASTFSLETRTDLTAKIDDPRAR